MLNHLDETDDVEGGFGFAREGVEIEDAESVAVAQLVRIGADIVAGECERATTERAARAEKFQETAGPAAEVEPAQGSGGGDQGTGFALRGFWSLGLLVP